MTRYRVTWSETLTATIEADSEHEVRLAWLEGDLDDRAEATGQLLGLRLKIEEIE